METTLRLPKIRENLIEELSKVLSPDGYKVKDRKGENSFLKKHDDGYFEIQFFYNNFFPIDYTVQFVFKSYQKIVQKVIESFCQSTKRNFTNISNIIFTEGDFVEELRGRLVKYRSGYKNRLVVEEDLERMIYRYKQLLNEKIRPLEYIFSSMESTADYLYKNRDLIVGNCDENMLMTSLISLKMIDSKEYGNLYEYYLEELPKQEAYGVLAERALTLTKDLHRFFMHDNKV